MNTATATTHWSEGQPPPPPMTWREVEQALFELADTAEAKQGITARLQDLAKQTPYRPPVGVWRDVFNLALESTGDPFSSAGKTGEGAMA